MGRLSVITMNCLGLPLPVPGLRRRLQALGKALAAADSDIACLQEVGRWQHLQRIRADEQAWPYALAVQYPYAPKGGLVTLSRLPFFYSNYAAFHEQGARVSLHTPERLQAKGMLLAVLHIAGRDVIVFNTHLAANYSARWSHGNPFVKVERAQLKELAKAVESIPDETIVVVAGDFNVPRGNWLYHEFLAATRLHDPLQASAEPTYRPLPGMPARAAQALDHILVRCPRGLAVTANSELRFGEPVHLAHGLTGYLSDHLAVRLTLEWPDTAPEPSSDQALSVDHHAAPLDPPQRLTS